MKFLFAYLIGMFIAVSGFGQTPHDTIVKSWVVTFLDPRTPDSVKYTNNNAFKDLLQESLQGADRIMYDFSSLTSVSIQQSTDKKVVVFTWFLLTSKGYEPQGAVWAKLNRKRGGKLTVLQDVSGEVKNTTYKSLTKGKWHGALYYQMVPFKVKRETHYLLLGFNGQDGLTHQKVIDILSVQSNGEPRFGSPLFTGDKRMACRVVFQYSAKAKMSLRYNERKKMVVFDHLSPGRNGLEGQYQFYGPDFSYDAYILERGKWVYKKDIDARNDSENMGKEGEMMPH